MAVNRKHKKDTTTAIVPQRVMDKVSPWLMPQEQQTTKDFTGWLGKNTICNLETNVVTSITVTSNVELGGRHSRMFHLANRVARTTPEHKGSVHIEDVLEELGISNRTENRKKVIKILKECVGMTISIEQDKKTYMFHMIESTTYDDETGVVTFRVSPEYYKATEIFQKRFINTSSVMKLRESNDIAIELHTYLQLRGSGVDSNTGEAKPAKKVYHDDLVIYLHLVHSVKEENRIRVLRRAFKSLHNQGLPLYKFMHIDGEDFWTYDASAKPAKRYKDYEELSLH